MIFRIGFEGYFRIACSALEVKTENFYSKVGFLVANLHSHIEFSSNIQIVLAGATTQTHWQHVAYHHQLVLTSTSFHYNLMVEVFGEIFYQHLTFSHF
jgi:hypothetical protein